MEPAPRRLRETPAESIRQRRARELRTEAEASLGRDDRIYEEISMLRQKMRQTPRWDFLVTLAWVGAMALTGAFWWLVFKIVEGLT